jgi:hypothetical protein
MIEVPELLQISAPLFYVSALECLAEVWFNEVFSISPRRLGHNRPIIMNQEVKKSEFVAHLTDLFSISIVRAVAEVWFNEAFFTTLSGPGGWL